jgi:putative transposase
MGSTYLSLHFHIIFSTKNREPIIADSWINDLHAYLGGILKGLGGIPEKIGGVQDHVHLLVGLKATHRLADVVRELKKASNEWIRVRQHLQNFHWQDGYATFTVSPNAREPVAKYIANQKEHHRERSFREELVELLKKAGIDYDERYWD